MKLYPKKKGTREIIAECTYEGWMKHKQNVLFSGGNDILAESKWYADTH